MSPLLVGEMSVSTGTIVAHVIAISGDRVVVQVVTEQGPVLGICRVPSLAGEPPGKWMSVLHGKQVMLTGSHQDGNLIAEIMLDGVPLSVMRSVVDSTFTLGADYPWQGWVPHASQGLLQSFHQAVEGVVSVMIVCALLVLILLRKSAAPEPKKSPIRALFSGFMGMGSDSLSTRVEIPPKTGDQPTRSAPP